MKFFPLNSPLQALIIFALGVNTILSLTACIEPPKLPELLELPERGIAIPNGPPPQEQCVPGRTPYGVLESKKNASPLAVKLLKEEFFWNIVDEGGPFGNDDGADTYCAYVKVSHSISNPSGVAFLDDMLDRWGLRSGILSELSSPAIRWFDYMQSHMRNNAVISVAFAQLINYGKVDEKVRVYATNALKQENSNGYLDHWGGNLAYRRGRVQRMLEVLEELKEHDSEQK